MQLPFKMSDHKNVTNCEFLAAGRPFLDAVQSTVKLPAKKTYKKRESEEAVQSSRMDRPEVTVETESSLNSSSLFYFVRFVVTNARVCDVKFGHVSGS